MSPSWGELCSDECGIGEDPGLDPLDPGSVVLPASKPGPVCRSGSVPGPVCVASEESGSTHPRWILSAERGINKGEEEV